MSTGSYEQIINACNSLFVEQGIRGTSLSDIIRLTGMSKGAIYHHFPHKEAIANTVARRNLDLIQQLIKQIRGQSTESAISAVFEAFRRAGTVDDQFIGNALLVFHIELRNDTSRLANQIRDYLSDISWEPLPLPEDLIDDLLAELFAAEIAAPASSAQHTFSQGALRLTAWWRQQQETPRRVD